MAEQVERDPLAVRQHDRLGDELELGPANDAAFVFSIGLACGPVGHGLAPLPWTRAAG